ncbi:response regulator transcription factor [Paenibacillus tritici]|uniref:Response regulator transcription factor n=1 Tax=Paenibacillus tritici TaxID=1873425 RepID=A0ABX2DM50_9BACL|nr:response regulator transcription factor [Paenibacillus tritici]NQX44714.1 response regulator transcription factor [Paenibacillus tritici]
MSRIMIVEDDPKIADLLQSAIEKYGYEVVRVKDFRHVLQEFEQMRPELVLLDVNLPSYDGYYWCRQIRGVSTCPVLFISARDGEMDQIMALENGGDDYITKPFHSGIVLAKIHSHLRRAYGEYAGKRGELMLEKEGLKLYLERLELQYGQAVVTLTRKESDLIESLMERYPRVASREALLEKLWDPQAFVDENTLNVNIARARKKFQELGLEDAVLTVRGSGYRLNLSAEEAES